MKTKIKSIAAILLLTITIASCKKGDTGPAGKDGTNGNANVIATNNVTINTWSLSNSIYTATISASGITQNIVDKGIVMVYIQYGSQWVSLPDITGINSTVYAYELGKVVLINSNSDGTTPTNPSTQTFRIVIISASNREANPNVNWNNYSEVKQALNLKD